MQPIAAPRQLHQLVAQIMVIVRRAVNGFRDAPAVGIVAIGNTRPGLAHPRELAAVLPCVRPRAVAQEVADLVRRQALAANAREQVAPARVVVSVARSLLCQLRQFQLWFSCSVKVRNITKSENSKLVYHTQNPKTSRIHKKYCIDVWLNFRNVCQNDSQ